MSGTLKPCPFCGGKPVAVETHPGYGFIKCTACGCTMDADDSKTPDELTEDWNRRAERTCRNVEPENEENNWNELGFFTCSECGSTSKLDWAWHKDVDEYRYCLNCGAKVVDE